MRLIDPQGSVRRGTGLLLALALAIPCAQAQASPLARGLIRAAPPPTTSASPGAEVELDPQEAEARAAYAAGRDAYALGHYAQAVGYFERCFELSQRPELLFNIGQSYARWYEIDPDVAHLRRAKKLLENYLAYLEAQDEFDPKSREDARVRIEEIDAKLAAIDDATPEEPRAKKPVHKRAWFWVVIVGGAAVVAGAVTAGVVLGRRQAGLEDPELGILGSGGGVQGVSGGIPFGRTSWSR